MKIDYRWVQARLRALGFDPGPIDGIRGPHTDAAVTAFKRSIGFRARPYIGPLTLAALGYKDASEPKLNNLPWLDVVDRVRGFQEIRDNAALTAFLKSDGHALGDPARFPWCGDLVETAIRLALPDEPFSGALGENPYWARNWVGFGRQLDDPGRGCIGVWPRGSGGHVAFIVGQDADHWYVDGGNQSNSVSRVRIRKARTLLAARWPVTFAFDPEPLPEMSSMDLISIDEA